jgi:hypothetical protein
VTERFIDPTKPAAPRVPTPGTRSCLLQGELAGLDASRPAQRTAAPSTRASAFASMTSRMACVSRRGTQPRSMRPAWIKGRFPLRRGELEARVERSVLGDISERSSHRSISVVQLRG